MSATEESIDRRAETALATMAAALGACGSALDARATELSRVWAAAGRTLLERARDPVGANTEAEWLVLDAATDPLAPPWLIVDGLIALIVEHVAIDAPPHVVVEVDRSLAGLRRLGAWLRHGAQADR